MTQDVTAEGYPEPGPDNFNFEDYLEGVSTLPVFEHRVFLDQRSGVALGELEDELEQAATKLSSLNELISQAQQESSRDLVDLELDRLIVRADSLQDRMKDLEEQGGILRDRVLASAITLAFQVTTPEELGTVNREALHLFKKENRQLARGSEEDLDFMSTQMRYTLSAQIAHFCTGMTLGDGRSVPAPTREGAEKLLKTLIMSEVTRLIAAVGKGLSASQDWASKLDAGFPGGGSDVAEDGLGENSAGDGPILGGTSAGDADREEVRLVG